MPTTVHSYRSPRVPSRPEVTLQQAAFKIARMLRIKMYPAMNGDAFFVDAGGSKLLIDAGFASTYRDYIAPDLAQLSRDGGRLNLVVCTHIDADHIGGLLELFALNGSPGKRGIEVERVWHNSLRSLPEPATPSEADDQSVLEVLRRRGYPSIGPLPAPISARQGSSLAKLLQHAGYVWNGGAGTSCITEQTSTLHLSPGVSIEIIGPTAVRLEELRSFWLREVRRLGHSGASQPSDLLDDAYEMWCASTLPPATAAVHQIRASGNLRLADVYTPDTSIPNSSSIALIVHAGDARLMLLGDAWAEDIVARLRSTQVRSTPHLFDAIKVSHHGSLRNTSPELLEIADAPCFLISSDGSQHGHPDFEVLAEIVDRPAPFERHVFFNYETDASERLKQHVSRSQSAFKVHVVKNEWIDIGGDNK